MTEDFKNSAIVIGAGLSGLAVAKELRARDIPVKILEAQNQVADPWRSRHPQLRLNIHRHYAALPGKKMTRADGTFVRRDTVVQFLEEYAHDLDVDIHFGESVSAVERAWGGWQVVTNRGVHRAAYLIVATGRERLPVIPVWPGIEDFGGAVIHAADFADPRSYDGKRVLVVGAGNSGTDVLNHLSRSAPSKVWVSLRHGPSILPTRVFGFPLHRLAGLFLHVPKWSLDPLFAAIQWLAFGNLRSHGMRRHVLGGGTRMLREGVTFALDDGFVAALKSGRVEAVAETVGFTPNAVKLADGRKILADVVICATGYATGLAPLFEKFGVLDAEGRPLHPTGEPDENCPGLWFTGYRTHFKGFFHRASVGAQRIAEAISASEKKLSTVNRVTYGANDLALKALNVNGVNDDQ
ncbi:NAD(P)/FAD-dependent oxidoreductase [uncultured Roseobacter sp.]|uniref:flavin-containing monooxygenase n=1 Tax=uncultured Roseobacter sp. TaxID=114847 RepID=UPI00260F1F71|nr:NAD(P)/FAD-dependent oxidoreductase [uncultured Roseobacter sp.]